MGSKLSKEQMACVLAEAEFGSDGKVAEKWNVTGRTVRAWRSKLKEDSELLGLFEQKKKEFAASWLDDATAALKAGSKRLKDLFSNGDPRESDLIDSIARAVKVLGELNITFEALKSDEPDVTE